MVAAVTKGSGEIAFGGTAMLRYNGLMRVRRNIEC
jgi:hypothetical protein